jgi:hypothetical protein
VLSLVAVHCSWPGFVAWPVRYTVKGATLCAASVHSNRPCKCRSAASRHSPRIPECVHQRRASSANSQSRTRASVQQQLPHHGSAVRQVRPCCSSIPVQDCEEVASYVYPVRQLLLRHTNLFSTASFSPVVVLSMLVLLHRC